MEETLETSGKLNEALRGEPVRFVDDESRTAPDTCFTSASILSTRVGPIRDTQVIVAASNGNTTAERLPDWARELTTLQYLYIEVNVATSNLEYLPHGLFAKMDGMHFVRIGRTAKLVQLPSLTGLHRLSNLFLTGLYGLRELPSFDDLAKLSILYIVDATHAQHLPSLQNLKNLKSFSLFRCDEMCCNGFLTGICDFSDFQCLQCQGEPKVQCVSDRIPAQDLERITKAGGFVCSMDPTVDLSDLDPSVSSSGDMCGGVLYRECFVGARRGMCFNSRLQVVMCDFMGEYEVMRRLHIA